MMIVPPLAVLMVPGRVPEGLMNTMMTMLQMMSRQSRTLIVVVGLLLVLQIGLLDLITGTEFAFGIFYLLPVALVAWLAGKGPGVAIAAASAVASLQAHLLTGQISSHPLLPYWNALVHFGFFLIVSDLLTDLKEKSLREKELRGIDDLTTLANRKTFWRLANEELVRARRYRHPVTLAYLDLDDFRLINELDGQGTGDALLFRVADTLSRSVRSTDVVGRLGGDEFGILLPNTSYEQAQVALARFQQVLESTLTHHNWRITWSLGVVSFAMPPLTVDAMVNEAEHLVTAVKSDGKNSTRHERARVAEQPEPQLTV